MKDPVKNTLCGHSYERKSILRLMKSSINRCPVSICSNSTPILIDHLVRLWVSPGRFLTGSDKSLSYFQVDDTQLLNYIKRTRNVN